MMMVLGATFQAIEKGRAQMSIDNINRSLEYASTIQGAVLPKKRHLDRMFDDSFIIYLPQHYVSGDFYWVAEIDGLKYIAVGDCTGHGVPGALLSMLGLSLLNYAVLQKRIKKTYKIMRELDKRFSESFSCPEYGTAYNNDWIEMALCCIDEESETIYFSGARKKILLLSDKTPTLYQGNSYPIGGWQLEENRSFESSTIPYKKGDVLFLGSDGFQDQLGGNRRKRFNSSRLHQLLTENSHLPLQEQKDILIQQFNVWKGSYSQIDDVCMLGFRL